MHHPIPFTDGNSAELATLPMSSPVTELGVILGTVAYMSPEQAEGRAIDRRTDIFAFGTILFEMVSGRRPFAGETPMATLTAIVQGQAPTLASILPGQPELARVVDRCLRKDLARRWQHIDDVKVALVEIKDALDSGGSPVASAASSSASTRSALSIAAVAAIAGVVLGALGVWAIAPRTEPPPTIAALTRLTADDGLTIEPALSPDGKLVAYASDRASVNDMGGNTDIWVQQIAGGQAIRLTQDPGWRAHRDGPLAFSPAIASQRGVREPEPVGGCRQARLQPGGANRKCVDAEVKGSAGAAGSAGSLGSAGFSTRRTFRTFRTLRTSGS